MAAESPRWKSPILATIACAGIIAAVWVLMLRWTAFTWPDVLVDFGRELYVPWQISAGKCLYRDIAYFNGPLSPYVNALLFRLFGTSIRTLFVANLGVVATLSFLIFRVFSEITHRWVATLCCCTFLGLFAFGQILETAGYNFIAPYSHELTHGVLLAFLGLYFVAAYRKARTGWAAGLAGLAVGLMSLTKPEVFLAGGLAVTVTFLLLQRRPATECREPRWLAPSLFAAGVVLPGLLAWLLFARALGAGPALRALTLGWSAASNTSIVGLKFYRICNGTLDLAYSFGRLGQALLWLAAWLLPAALLGFSSRIASRTLRLVTWVAGAGVFLAIGLRYYQYPWLDLLRPLPMILAGLLLWTLVRCRRAAGPERDRLAILVGVQLFSLVLLAKLGLFARICHYGFALAMPATLVALVALFDWAPEQIRRRGGHPLPLWGAAGLLLVGFAYLHFNAFAFFFAQKSYPVGRGGDGFYADARGVLAEAAVDWLGEHTPTGSTVMVLPEGATINYLARRPNPTPYLVFMPPELILFGEDRMVQAMEAAPPDYVVLVDKNTSEYGYRYFGTDYGRGIMGWVVDRYAAVALFGDPPLTGKGFGIAILQRNPAPAPTR